MKKIFYFIFMFTLFFPAFVFADRDNSTIATYKTSQLIKTGNGKIYSVNFIATAANGNFIIYDGTSYTVATDDPVNVKSEGSEATSGNSQFKDYTNKPIPFTTGLYLTVTNGFVTLNWE